jgi:hypothetical protein
MCKEQQTRGGREGSRKKTLVGWAYGSSSRAPAQQELSLEFKPQYHHKKKKKKERKKRKQEQEARM